MTTLHIEHPISDFTTWRGAFQRFAGAREEAGVLWHSVSRPIDDDAYVVVDLGFSSTEQAQAFLAFLRDRVWADSSSSPALAGVPETRLLRLEEHRSMRDVE